MNTMQSWFDPNIPDVPYRGVLSYGHPSYGKWVTPPALGVNKLVSKQYLPGAHAYRVKPQAAEKLLEVAKTHRVVPLTYTFATNSSTSSRSTTHGQLWSRKHSPLSNVRQGARRSMVTMRTINCYEHHPDRVRQEHRVATPLVHSQLQDEVRRDCIADLPSLTLA